VAAGDCLDRLLLLRLQRDLPAARVQLLGDPSRASDELSRKRSRRPMRAFLARTEFFERDRPHLRELRELLKLFGAGQLLRALGIENAFAREEAEDALPPFLPRHHVPEPLLVCLRVDPHQARVKRTEEHLAVEPAEARRT